jgi:hypothetical protein
MHSRFWTFCAGANVFLFLLTLSVIYFNKDKAQRLNSSLFHRDVVGWGEGGVAWRQFYDANMDSTNETWAGFLPSGLMAVGCTEEYQSPVCTCLASAHSRTCRKSAKQGMLNCFMNTRPVIKITELDRTLNLYALLDALNLWGMMGSVVIWIRMYICKEDESMPYSVQFILGLFTSIIHCSVLEPQLSSYITYILLTALLSFLSYVHRLDKCWWLSMYMLQYAFTVPNMVTLAFVATQKRDMLYVIVGFMLSVAYGLTAIGRALLDDAADESMEGKNAYNVVRAAMIFIFLMLTLGEYPDYGDRYLRSFSTTAVAHGFTVVLIAYLFLGLLCPNNLKRVCVSDWCIRFVTSMLLITELIHAPTSTLP